MARTRMVKIPDDFKCNECGSIDLVGAGMGWKRNPNSDNPPRIKVQKFLCKTCGKITLNGEVLTQ